MPGTALSVPDPRRRAELAEFVARVVQLDPAATVRLRGSGSPGSDDGGGLVTAWAGTPFGVLATRAVPGRLTPADVAVPASALLTALAVDRSATVDPGSGAAWRAELPPDTGWADVAERPAADWAELVTGDLRAADGPHGPSEAWLDETAATVPGPAGSAAVRIPRRCLFALSGLGLLAEAEPGAVVRVVATGGWLRLDVPGGAVVRRRHPALPLLF